MKRTLAEQEAELHDELRALGRALLATPLGQFTERCAVWLLTRLERCAVWLLTRLSRRRPS